MIREWVVYVYLIQSAIGWFYTACNCSIDVEEIFLPQCSIRPQYYHIYIAARPLVYDSILCYASPSFVLVVNVKSLKSSIIFIYFLYHN